MSMLAGLVGATLSLGGGDPAPCPPKVVPAVAKSDDPKTCCASAKRCGELPVAARLAPPVPIASSLLLPMASPTVGPQAKGRISVRVDVTATRRTPSRDGELTLVRLPLTGGPTSLLPWGWLGVTIASEIPGAATTSTAARATPAPPSRQLPTPVGRDGQVVELPPLPDEAVEPASAPSDEARPSPQARPKNAEPKSPGVASGGRVDAPGPGKLTGRTVVMRGVGPTPSTAVWEELVLFPAPVPQPAMHEAPCPEDGPLDRLTANPRAASKAATWRSAMMARNATGAVEAGAHNLPKTDYELEQTIAAALRADAEAKAVRRTRMGEESALRRAGSTLALQLKSPGGVCEYDAELRLQPVGAKPCLILVPMPDGTMIEVQARVVPKPRD